ncbi:MAG: gliding motility-associated peptidyl-prolyl isomerase GldI [Aurantibacter sp.]
MRNIILVLLTVILASCGGPEPRRPVKIKSGSFYKESAERNRQLLEREEKLIQEIIAQDTSRTYVNSASGSWYFLWTKNEGDDYRPHVDDLVTMTYDVLTFDNDTIYSFEDIGILKYKVDKQELFPGLRDAVKLLKENETATFLFPSSLAFGYHGDNDKIGVNVPLKSTVTILKIERQQDDVR